MKNISTKRIPCFRRWRRTGWSAFATIHRQVTIGVLSATMSILLLPAQRVSAQESDTLAVLRSLRIDEVGISGSPNAPTHNALAQNPLFDRKTQATAPVQTLEAALRLAPSVDLRERGCKGAQADISIRGGSFDQTMVLLNGIDFTDARTGHQSHSLPVDLEAISSMELIDGLPGVGAYAGAVNVRTTPLYPDYLRFEAVGGEHGYGYAHLSGATTSEHFSLLGAASYRHSEGYRHNTDLNNVNAFLRATWSTKRCGFFELQSGYQRRAFGSNGFYAAYNPDQWERTSTALASLRWSLDAGSCSYGASLAYRKNFDRYDWTRGTPMNYHNTDHAGAGFWFDWRWKGGTSSLGGNYAYDHIFSTNLGEELAHPRGVYTHGAARHSGNVWMRHTWRRGGFDASASAGISITPYGESALWNLDGGYTSPKGWSLRAGVSQSMRLPTFTDLYYHSPAQINNLDLIPEHAVTFRTSARYAKSCWDLNLLLYLRAGRDIIDWVRRADMEGKWHSEQTNRLNTFGTEWSVAWHAESGFLRRVMLSYAFVTTDRISQSEARSSLDYMRHKGALSVEVHFLRRLTLTTTAALYDRNGSYIYYPVAGDASISETKEFNPYFMLDSRLSWEKGICRIYIDAANLTGTRYCDFGGIPLPGRWMIGGVSILIR